MIARRDNENRPDASVWAALSAPVDPAAIAWRQDGKVIARGGGFFARFVCYIEANTVRERLDQVAPGEWDLTLELLPERPDADGVAQTAFKARLAVLGVVREDVGVGRDFKAAATDAFKRAAVRFGIGHELYDYEQNWVEVDGDKKFAKPLEDPAAAYARRYGPSKANGQGRAPGNGNGNGNGTVAGPVKAEAPMPGEQPPAEAFASPTCPKCGGRMWDNRASKRNPKAPDFKCRDRRCDGVIWPGQTVTADGDDGDGDDHLPYDNGPFGGDDDDLPF